MLEEKVAIVTGGSRGIGRAIALDLAKHGAKVVVNYNSNVDAANETVAAVVAAGSEGLAVQADVSNFEEAQGLAKQTIEKYGKIDILDNNAGKTKDTLIMIIKANDWDTVLDINLKSVFN
ncbi:MAG: SDR family NAD(P)-dependent oxidoreductase, partial [Chloroflexota bacterium]